MYRMLELASGIACKRLAVHALATFSLLIFILAAAEAANAQVQRLEHGWQLMIENAGPIAVADVDITTAGWRPVKVGVSWNAQFADLRDYMGAAWYRTDFDSPQLRDGKRALLRFGAIDYYAEIYVNGRRIGAHEGGYTPFTFDVTAAVKAGRNRLTIRVVDPPMNEAENRSRFPEFLYTEIPHGKQNWYVQTGGIWQPVSFEIRPPVYIDQVHVTAQVNGTFDVEVRLGGALHGEVGRSSLDLTLYDHDQHVVFSKSKITESAEEETISGQIKSPRLWSPENPFLYTLDIRLNDLTTSAPGLAFSSPNTAHTRTSDDKIVRFGFRSFEARDGKFFLNGRLFYLIAALDQDFYPETIYTPPSKEYVRDEMLKAKGLGLNVLRCHIKVPDPVYLEAADEVGMLVWYEIPSWNDFNHFTPRAAERGEQTFREMVARDWNHPSIIIQSIINESWGADLKQSDQRKWLHAAYERAKTLTDPLHRLIVDNSACCDNFHVATDIDDFHQYYSIPDNYPQWDHWVADFATRPRWSFSPFGDGRSTGREPLVVSEFGNWGLPRLPRPLPWWFDRDFAGREVTRPAGVLERFRTFNFNSVFVSFDRLAEETEQHQFISLKHEIEEMRRFPTIQGYVITELTDVNWEANGLMDMYRHPKVYATELARIQQQDVVIGHPEHSNYRSGETIRIETELSHYAFKELGGINLSWKTEWGVTGTSSASIMHNYATVEPLSTLTLRAPRVNKPSREKVFIRVNTREGKVIAENSYELFIFPTSSKQAQRGGHTLVFYDPSNSNARLKAALTSSSPALVSQSSGVGAASLMIATTYDNTVATHLAGGGRAILLANGKNALPAGAAVRVVPRAGSDLDGNWVTNFNWVKPGVQPFRELAFSPILGFEAFEVLPKCVIQGIRSDDYKDVLAGIFYGWVNDNAALAVQLKVKGGGLFLTTFRFDAYGRDPYSTELLDSIIDYVQGPNFKPNMEALL